MIEEMFVVVVVVVGMDGGENALGTVCPLVCGCEGEGGCCGMI